MSDKNELLLGIKDPAKLREVLGSFNTEDLLLLRWKMLWRKSARRKQIPPSTPWKTFGIRCGRGFGKTLMGAQWIGQGAASDPGSYNFVVAPTHDDVRYTCFEGPTGLFSVIPPQFIADCNLTLPSITLTNRSIIRGFAAVAPERLRGPQSGRIWADEIASWREPQKSWDNMMFGLRLGSHPQLFWTGTPKPTAFMRKLCSSLTDVLVLGSTYENSENLPDSYYENVAKYEGTKIGRQELYGELIDPEEAGFVKRSDWRLWPATRPLPKFKFIVLSLDTAFTEKTFDKDEQENDPTACSVWGMFEYERKEHIMLLDCWEDHLGFPDLVKKVKRERSFTYGDADEPLIKVVVGSQRPAHQGRRPDLVLIEDKGSGVSLRQSLAVENIFAEPYNPGRMDKLSRLHAVSPLFPNKRIWAVESKNNRGQPVSWADPLITQVCTYVGEGSLEHDDLLDTTTQALKFLMDKFRMTFTNRVDPDAKTKEALERLKRQKKSNPYDG